MINLQHPTRTLAHPDPQSAPDGAWHSVESERFRLLVQNSSDLLTVLGSDGTVLYQSPSIERLLGHKPEERIGKNIFRSPLVHPEDATRKRAFLEAALRTPDAPVTAEFRLRHADGSWRHIEAIGRNLLHDPRIAGVVANYRDVTDRRAGEQRLRALAEALPQLVWTARPDGGSDYFNRRWTEFTGLTLEQSLGFGWCEALHPEDRPRCLRHLAEALLTGQGYEIEYRLRRADGIYRWYLRRAEPLRDDEGRVTRWFGTCTDIDDQKRAEQVLREAKEAAEAASRAKDQFLATLSHELRTPLTPALMAATAMLEDPGTTAERRPYWKMVRDSVELEARLIDDLLDVARITQGKMTFQYGTADAHDLIRRTVANCRSDLLGKQLRVTIDLAASERHVRADAARLQQVLWNLLKNAIKFSPEGGEIRIGTRNRDGHLVVEVKDGGIGIEPETLSRIFNAFEQTGESITRRFGGLGLGLAISRSIVEAHGGSLIAASEGRGKGATFTFDLATATPSSTGAEGAGPTIAEDRPGRRLRVLLVEDDPMTARTTERLLRRRGYFVTTAHSLAEALGTDVEGYDVVVSDLGLPDGNGLDLMREVKTRHGIPGIALTGFGRDDDIARSRAAGFIAHLTKPVDFARLEATIRQVAAPARGVGW